MQAHPNSSPVGKPPSWLSNPRSIHTSGNKCFPPQSQYIHCICSSQSHHDYQIIQNPPQNYDEKVNGKSQGTACSLCANMLMLSCQGCCKFEGSCNVSVNCCIQHCYCCQYCHCLQVQHSGCHKSCRLDCRSSKVVAKSMGRQQMEFQNALRESLSQQQALNDKVKSLSRVLKSKKRQHDRQRQSSKSRTKLKTNHYITKGQRIFTDSQTSDSPTSGRIWKNNIGPSRKNPNHKQPEQSTSKIKINDYGLSSLPQNMQALNIPKNLYISGTRSLNPLPNIRYPTLCPEIYKDANHRNLKHEKQHLYQTFKLQSRLRNNFINKITDCTRKMNYNKRKSRSTQYFIH